MNTPTNRDMGSLTETSSNAAPSISALRVAVEMEIASCLGNATTRRIGELVQKAIDERTAPLLEALKEALPFIDDDKVISVMLPDGREFTRREIGKLARAALVQS